MREIIGKKCLYLFSKSKVYIQEDSNLFKKVQKAQMTLYWNWNVLSDGLEEHLWVYFTATPRIHCFLA